MDDANELIDLGQYLCGLLRKAHISTLFTNNNNLSLNEVLKQSDQIGIPYCLILRSNSLKNGFVYLRNRDTTLEVCFNFIYFIQYQMIFLCVLDII